MTVSQHASRQPHTRIHTVHTHTPPPHYVAANAKQSTTWGTLPPFPAYQSAALNAAGSDTHSHVCVCTHVRL